MGLQEAAQALDKVLAKFSEDPASTPDAEQELLRALAKKYEHHRGTGDDAKWAVLLREFNVRVVEALQKSEASLKRAMKKLNQESEKAAVVEDSACQKGVAAVGDKENVEPTPDSKDEPAAEASQ